MTESFTTCDQRAQPAISITACDVYINKCHSEYVVLQSYQKYIQGALKLTCTTGAAQKKFYCAAPVVHVNFNCTLYSYPHVFLIGYTAYKKAVIVIFVLVKRDTSGFYPGTFFLGGGTFPQSSELPPPNKFWPGL